MYVCVTERERERENESMRPRFREIPIRFLYYNFKAMMEEWIYLSVKLNKTCEVTTFRHWKIVQDSSLSKTGNK